MLDLKNRIAANLASFERVALPQEGRRRAAVAILVCPYKDKPHYILTRRSLKMRRGAGNYALPGGNCDPGEEIVDAAVREVREELGITIAREAALGMLDDFLTLGGHVVTPIVLLSTEPFELKPDPDEVHAAWFLPLSELDHPEAPRRIANPDGGDPILRMYANRSWINPPTAAWLYQFREVALHGREARVHTVGQPSWTR